MLKRGLSLISRALPFVGRETTVSLQYWKNRVSLYGKRAVLNISHGEEEYERVTEHQKRMIFPYLLDCLSGNERTILDFGCGRPP